MAISTPAPARAADGPWKSITQYVRRRGKVLEAWIARKSPVGNAELLDPAHFPWAAELEANWTTIRRELDGVLGHRGGMPPIQDLSPTQYSITREQVWKVFGLYAYGTWFEKNCRQCPETARLLRAIPDLELAFFSVLEPGAHLAAHRGAYKGLIRAHLGLLVPEPRAQVRMQVGRETVVWREGKCVVFDDTYRHEVWNDTDGVRVVLLFDVARPFPWPLALVNKTLLRIARLTPPVRTFVKRLRVWEDKGHDRP